ncbi:MAG: hypothetical protein LBU67_01025, partial [Oscillospiraceae bacterium]|nr:hypothetical protein [Oscillospiraceae bacterium]
MKKMLWVLLLAGMIGAQPYAACAASTPTLLFAGPGGAQTFVQDMALAGDTLYLVTDRVWRYGIDDAEPQALEDALWRSIPNDTYLVRGTEKLTVIDRESG